MSGPPLRRVGVTGTVVEDTIDSADGVRTEDLGGIIYALHALSALLPSDWVAFAILGVGEDAIDRVRCEIDDLHGIDTAEIAPVACVNNKVHIRYREAGGRDEILTGGVPPQPWEFFAPWVDQLDVWLWNFISGMEVDRETFARLKREFRGPIHMDFHSLALEHVQGQARRHRRPERWEAWIEGATWLQLNAEEAGVLWRDRPQALPSEEEAAFAERILGLGVRGILVTLGSGGVRWYGSGDEYFEEPAVSADPPLDATGCGDVFGAAWVALHAACGRPVRDALAGAVEVAGAAAAVRGTRGLADRLRELSVARAC